ncbi:unnamed protein product [Nippostrongylus brasiliensis]|uniref:Uncharacterized protein n=1 Tax=Nippostrongylus brasiliensis TaxID=27835 RepID=A0A0N4XF44_NIPBR|nr:unnamed protein product [Nippostrongylus brasiliensis]
MANCSSAPSNCTTVDRISSTSVPLDLRCSTANIALETMFSSKFYRELAKRP